MSSVPLCATRDDDLTLNRRFTTLAPWREDLMEVQMAEEAWRGVGTVFVFEAGHIVVREESDVFTALTGVDTGGAFGVFVVGLGVEGYALEMFTALVTGEAFRVEAGTTC